MRLLYHLTLLISSLSLCGQSPTFTESLHIVESFVCKGGSIHLNANSANASTYFLQTENAGTWEDFPGYSNTILDGNISILFSNVLSSTKFRLRIVNQTSSEEAFSNTVEIHPQLPEITTQPIDLIDCYDETATFYIKATGQSTLNYQWEVNPGSGFTAATGSKYSGENTNKLEVSRLRTNDHGVFFRCRITDQEGCEVLSSEKQISVNHHGPPLPTTSQKFCEGQTATLTASKVVGEATAYQWLGKFGTINYEILEEGLKYVGSNTAELQVKNLQLKEKNYRLEITFSNKKMDEEGNAIEGTCMYARERTGYTIHERPVMLQNPQLEMEICGEGPANLFVEAEETLPLYWFQDSTGLALAEGREFLTDILDESTTFYAAIQNDKGCFSTFKSVEATVHPLPQIIQGNFLDVCPKEDNITFQFEELTEGGNLFLFSSNWAIFGSEKEVQPELGQAAFSLPEEASAGNYTIHVILKNSVTGCNSVSLEKELRVLAPTKILTDPSPLEVCRGNAAEFSITAEGQGDLNYQWFKNGIPLTHQTASNLLLSQTTDGDLGSYHCQVTGFCGTAITEAAELNFGTATQITKQPTAGNVCLGNSLEIEVEAVGSGTLNYVWFIDGVPQTQNSPKLLIDVVTSPHRITCEVSGLCGKVYSEEIQLHIVDAPPIPASVSKVYCQGQEIIPIEITPSQAGNIIQWYNESNVAIEAPILQSTNIGKSKFYVAEAEPGACEGGKASIEIEVLKKLEVDINSATASICTSGELNRSISLQAISEGGSGNTNYIWKDIFGKSLSENEIFTVDLAGRYTLIGTSYSCYDSTGIEITNPIPAISKPIILTAANNSPSAISICPEQELRLFSNSENTKWYVNRSFQTESKNFAIEKLEGNTTIFALKEISQAGFTCQSDSTKLEVNLHPFPTLDIQISSETCLGDRNGKIQVFPKDEFVPYTFRLGSQGDLVSTNSFLGLEAGTYSLWAKNRFGCSKDFEISVSGSTKPIITSPISNQNNCKGNTVTFQAELENFSELVWQKLKHGEELWETLENEKSSSLRISNVGSSQNPNATKYRVQAKNGSCTIFSPPAVLEVNEFLERLDNQKICLGAKTDFIPPSFSGNVLNFEWEERKAGQNSWQSIQNSSNPTLSLENRTLTNEGDAYRVRLTFDRGNGSTCVELSDLGSISISNPEIDAEIKNPLCFGEATGEINIQGKNGEAPYEFAMESSSFENKNTFTSLLANTYFITIKDALGCLKEKELKLTNPQAISITNTEVVNNVCADAATGKISIEAKGGTGNLSFLWSTGSTDHQILNLKEGKYTLRVTDENSCLLDWSTELKDPAAMEISIQELTAATCIAVDGFASFSVANGTSPYTFKIADKENNSGQFEQLQSKNYQLQVLDADGCTIEKEIFIPEQNDISISNLILQPESCPGTKDGSIEIISTGANKFGLNPSILENVSKFENLSLGNYTVFLESSSGCKKDTTVYLDGGSFPEILKEPENQINCLGNTITFETEVSKFDNLQWEIQNSENSWENLLGENGQNLRLSNLGSTFKKHGTKFRLKTEKGTCSTYSKEVKLGVNQVVGDWNLSPVCSGKLIELDIHSLQTTGSIASLQWQYRKGTSGSWIDIEGETENLLRFVPNQTQYIRLATNFIKSDGSTCVEYAGGTSGNKVEVISVEKGKISGSTTICKGSTTIVSATGCNGTVLWSNGSKGNELMLSPEQNLVLTATCQVENCIEAMEGIVEINLEGDVVTPIISTNKTELCEGETTTFQSAYCDGTIIWSNGSSSTSLEIAFSGLEKDTYFSATCQKGICLSQKSDSILLRKSKFLQAGSISYTGSEQCAGYNPPTVVSEFAAQGGFQNESFVYQWEQKNGEEWQIISGADQSTFNPEALQQAIALRRAAVFQCGTVYTSPVNIPIMPDPEIEIISFPTTAICVGSVITLNSRLTGGAGTCTINWQQNVKSAAVSSTFWEDLNVSGQTVQLNVPNSEIQSVFYRAIVDCKPSSCNKSTSTPIAVSLAPSNQVVLNAVDTTICLGNQIALTATNCFGEILWSTGSRDYSIVVAPEKNTTYTVSCTTICGEKNTQARVHVAPALTAPMNTTPGVAVVPEVIQFSAEGENLIWFKDEVPLETAPMVSEPGRHIFQVAQFNRFCISDKTEIEAIIYEPLALKAQPTDQYDCKGNGVKYTVDAVGVGTLHYVWQRKRPAETDFFPLTEEHKGIRNPFTPFLTVSNVGSTDNPHGSLYRCQIIDSLGTLTSNYATLNANILDGSMPNQKICTGDDFSYNLPQFFSITGEVSGFQWQKRNEDTKEWEDLIENSILQGVQTAKLSIQNSTTSLSGNYRCSVTFNTGGVGCVENTDLSRLTVGIYPEKPAAQETDYCQEENAKKLSYTTDKYLDVIWYDKLEAEKSSGTSKAPTPQTDIAGTDIYWYSLRSDEGCESDKVAYTVHVHPRPELPQNTTPPFVDEGSVLEFTAMGENLKWYTSRTGKNFVLQPKHSEIGTYDYWVSSTSRFSCESHRVFVESRILPVLAFLEEPKDVSECDGNSLEFKVKARGRGEIAYQWFAKKPSQTAFIPIEGAKNSSLKITKAGDIDFPDQSRIKCQILDSTGSVFSKEVVLTVNTFESQFADLMSCEGSLLHLEAGSSKLEGNLNYLLLQQESSEGWRNVDSSKTIGYTWENVRLENAGKYRYRAVFQAEGNATCVRSSNSFKVDVLARPSLFQLASDIELCQGEKMEELPENTTLLEEIKNTGSYSYFTKNSFGCSSDTGQVFIRVHPIPSNTFLGNELVACSFSQPSSTFTSMYTFKQEGKTIAIDNFFQNPQSALLEVSTKSEQGCESESKTILASSRICLPETSEACLGSSKNGLQEEGWNYVSLMDGKTLLGIQAKEKYEGKITVSYKNQNQITSPKGTKYAPRYIHILAQPELPKDSRLQLLFTEEELSKLFAETPEEEKNRQALQLYFYQGINADCELFNNDNLEGGRSTQKESKLSFSTDEFGNAILEVNYHGNGEYGISANVLVENVVLERVQENGETTLRLLADREIRKHKYHLFKVIEGQLIPLPEKENGWIDPFPLAGENVYAYYYEDKDGVRSKIKEEMFIDAVEQLRCFAYPNPIPLDNTVQVWHSHSEKPSMEILNDRGIAIMAKVVEKNSHLYQVEFPTILSRGVYLVKLSSDSKTCTMKLVK